MKHVTKCLSPYMWLTFNFLAIFALFCISNMVSADSLGGVAENVKGFFRFCQNLKKTMPLRPS